MESLYLLIPVSVILVFVIGAIFWWALKSGQLDDLEGPAYRVLMDDDAPRQTSTPREGAHSPTVDPDQSK
ncbi:MAG: cbb3-type cytochrome oxidase assembly protein CcoS [Rhodocyclaceae bacterium]